MGCAPAGVPEQVWLVTSCQVAWCKRRVLLWILLYDGMRHITSFRTHGVAVAERVVGRNLAKHVWVGHHCPEEVHRVNLKGTTCHTHESVHAKRSYSCGCCTPCAQVC